MRSKLWTKISGLFVFAGVALGCATGAVMNNDMHKVSAAETTTIVLDAPALGLTGTATSNEKTVAYNGIDFVVSKGAKLLASSSATNAFTKDGAIFIGKQGTYIYNKTALGTITKFEIFANANASKNVIVGVQFGTSMIAEFDANDVTYSQKLETLNSVYTVTGIPENSTYFRYQVTNANNSQVQFRITYSGEAGTSGPVEYYDVSYNANGGEGTMATSTDSVVDECTFTKEGHFFWEWNTAADGSGTTYSAGDTVGQDTTLYAIWQENPHAIGDQAIFNFEVYSRYAGWENDTQYTSASIDPITLTVTESGTSDNSGKYYTNGYQWRLYQSESATLTVSAAAGYQINGIQISYLSQNTGVLLDGTEKVVSGDTYSYDAGTTTKTFAVSDSDPTDDENNGQARITEVVVLFSATGADLPELTSISLDTSNFVKTYEVGDDWSTEGLVTTATYDDASSKEVAATYTFNPATPALETKSVEITAEYLGKTTTVPVTGITVTEPEPLTCAEAKTTLAKGDQATVKGVVAAFYQGTQFLLVDQATSEGILIYTSTNFGLAIGDEVIVSGEYDLYNNLPELKDVTVTELASGKTVTPRVVDALTETDFAQHIADYVTVKNMKFVKDEVSETSTSNVTIDTSAQGFKIYSHKNDKAARSVWNNAFANYKDLESTVVFDITGIMGAYKDPQMYLTSDTVIDVNEYATFVNYMNETVKDVCGANPETVTGETWTTAETLFGYLSADEKAAFKALAADQAGTAEQQAAARYDQIVAKRAAKDFAGRDTGATSNRVTSILNNNNNNLVLIIVIASSLVAVAAIAFIYYRKRQLNK